MIKYKLMDVETFKKTAKEVAISITHNKMDNKYLFLDGINLNNLVLLPNQKKEFENWLRENYDLDPWDDQEECAIWIEKEEK